MTLVRKAYKITVQNLTRGWTYTLTQDDEPDPLVDNVFLVDDFAAGWSTIDSKPWQHLDPSWSSVKVYSRSAEYLPDIDYDDEVVVLLERPTAGTPIRYARVFGTVSDIDVSGDWKQGVVLSFVVTDPVAIMRSTELTVDNAAVEKISPIVPDAYRAGESFDYWSDIRDAGFGTTYEGLESPISVADFYTIFYNSLATTGMSTWRIAHNFNGPAAGWNFRGPNPAKYRLYTEKWPLPQEKAATLTPTLLTLGVVAGVVKVVDHDPSVLATTLTTIPASAVASAPAWAKDSHASSPRVLATGYKESTNSVVEARVGETSFDKRSEEHEFPTMLEDAYYALVKAAEHRRSLLTIERGAWRVRALKIFTEHLTDAQLDYLANGRLYPRPYPDDIDRGIMPIAVVGIDPRGNLGGELLIGLPVVATFTIAGGELSIEVTTSPWTIRAGDTPGNIPGPTFNAWDAVASLINIDLNHVDPRLSLDDLKFAEI